MHPPSFKEQYRKEPFPWESKRSEFFPSMPESPFGSSTRFPLPQSTFEEAKKTTRATRTTSDHLRDPVPRLTDFFKTPSDSKITKSTAFGHTTYRVESTKYEGLVASDEVSASRDFDGSVRYKMYGKLAGQKKQYSGDVVATTSGFNTEYKPDYGPNEFGFTIFRGATIHRRSGFGSHPEEQTEKSIDGKEHRMDVILPPLDDLPEHNFQ